MHGRPWLAIATRAAALLAPPLVVFVFPTLSLLGRNIEYFPRGYETGAPLYAAAVVSLAAGILLTVAARRPPTRFLLAMYLFSAAAWFLHALLRQASQSLLVSVAVVAAWIGGAVVASRWSNHTVFQYAAVAAAALLVGSGAPAIASTYDGPAGTDTDTAMVSNGGDPALANIYHIIFDEYQSDFFAHLLDDDLRRELRGFAFYPDTTVTYGRTPMSLASMFASQDYEYDVAPEEQIDRAFHELGSTLQALGDLGYHRTGWMHRTRAVGDPPALDDWMLQDELAATGRLPGHSDLLVSMWFYGHTPRAVSRRVLPAHHYQQLTADALLPEDAPPASVIALRELIRREAELPARGRYTLAHLILPHFPNVLDPDCQYMPGQTTGPAEQAACANLLIREFVSTLRSLDRLDDSIVILQSDHGSWYEVADGQAYRPRGQGYDSEQASTARARALLLVHLPDTALDDADELRIVDRPTLIEDIMPTVFEALAVEHDFSGNRVPLLSDVPADRVRHYHWYDKGEGGALTDGLLKRFRIEGDRAVFDREIRVPAPG